MKKSKPSKKDLQLIKYNQFGPKEMIKYRLIPPQEFPNSKIQFLLTFLSLLSKFGRLDIIKYLDQKYPFLLSKKSSLKNHSAKIEHRLLNPIFTKSDLVKILLLDSLSNDHLELFNYLSNDDRLDVGFRQFFKYSNQSQVVYQANKDKFESLKDLAPPSPNKSKV